MKKIALLALATATALSVDAQQGIAKKNYTKDADLPRWVIDLNFLGGVMTQDVTTATSTSGYTNGLNLNTGKLDFSKGSSFGGDGQLGYFFGPNCHWGVGAGLMYLSQSGTFGLDNYHVEYQATDAKNNIYRQHITGNNVEEQVKITNMNIPLMLKYKNRFSKRFGFTADAGPMFNIQMKNTTTLNGTFDYEAIRKWSEGGDGFPSGTQIYENSPVPSSENVEVITKEFYLSKNPGADVNALFNQHRANGEPVGLGVKPVNNKGDVNFTTGSVGFFVRPAISYYLSDHVALNLGLYYMYQSFNNNNTANYMLMNTGMQYNSSLNNVTKDNVQSFGGSLGVRFLFGKPKDTDKDGIPDKKDLCPEVKGLEKFKGCPDTDNDGIQDSEDACPTVPGLAKFKGCPDTDGDGIPDPKDECPTQAGPASLNGCPDRDGDGIADKNDVCPDKAGLAQFKGCPDTDGDGIPDNEDQCPEVAGPASNNGCPLPPPVVEVPLSTPILFETNKTVVSQVSMPVLETAIKTLKDDANAEIVIHGHADWRGTNTYNMKLSKKRAEAVKKELVGMGADPKRIKVMAHGEKDPVASNSTEEGMAQNRRAVMRLTVE